MSYLRDGVSVHEFLIDSHPGPSIACPYNADNFPFPGAVLANRITPAHAGFADAEINPSSRMGALLSEQTFRVRRTSHERDWSRRCPLRVRNHASFTTPGR